MQDRRIIRYMAVVAFGQSFVSALGHRVNDGTMFWVWSVWGGIVGLWTAYTETYLARRRRLDG